MTFLPLQPHLGKVESIASMGHDEGWSGVDKGEIESWATTLQELHGRIGHWFKREEVRKRAYSYMQGLLSNTGRKNGWQLAEQAGEERPDGMQRLMSTAVWDEDGVRDEVRTYVQQQLGAADGVLVLDETGFLKKGKASVGVKRQYSGTAGGIENCQIGVFLAYNSPKGHALIDRALYLPKEWIEDKERRIQAKIPTTQRFAKKATLGRQMLERAFDAQVKHQWVLGDCVYGDDRELREWLQARHEWYVLGITRHHLLYYEGARQRFDEIAASLPLSAWQQLSCGSGTKGERLYDWAMVRWHNVDYPDDVLHAFLVRRNPLDPTDEAYFRVFAPAGTSLPVLARVAGQRWTIEECFELAKDELGLDHYEVRSWHGWLRHTTLVMLTLAFLAVIRHREFRRGARNEVSPPTAMVSLSIPEIRHLLQALMVVYTAAFEQVIAWSRWRRIHQARAMIAHIRRQQAFLRKMRAFP